MTHTALLAVTQRIEQRSAKLRQQYLANIAKQKQAGKGRSQLSCGNLAHAVAAACDADKQSLLNNTSANLAIISSYNDMLSAHKPYESYPELIQQALSPLGHTSQVAGCVPAMCDGVTQGSRVWICRCFHAILSPKAPPSHSVTICLMVTCCLVFATR